MKRFVAKSEKGVISVISIVIGVAFTLGCVAGIVNMVLTSSDNIPLLVALVGLSLLGVLATIEQVRQQIVLTETHIEKYGFRAERIAYEELEHAFIEHDSIVLRAGNKKVKVPRDYRNRNELCAQIASRVPDRDKVAVHGDAELISVCWREVPPVQ